MIEEFFFYNYTLGETCYFNENDVPFRTLVMEVEVTNEERKKPQDHGYWPTRTYLGKRIFRAEGDLLQQDAVHYIERRQQMVRVLTHQTNEVSDVIGLLGIRFSGMSERVQAECTLEGWPELPMEALSPSRGTYMVAWKSFDPVLYGAVENCMKITWTAPAIGRTYPKTYGYTYGIDSSAEDPVYINGDIDTQPVIRFAGPMITPRVQVFAPDGTGSTIRLKNLRVQAGEIVTVDVKKKTAKSDLTGDVYPTTAGSDWFRMKAKTNYTVRLIPDFASPGSYMEYAWRNAYTL